MSILDKLISVISDRCVGCGACLRVCPAPEANIVKILDDGRRSVEVNDEKCIACGACLRACPHDARDYDDDSVRFMKDIQKKRIVLIVSPAIRAAFPDSWFKVLKWLKQEGVYAIYDMGLGGDIYSWATLRALEQGKLKNIISSHCPAVFNYINLYRPDLAGDISPIYNPAECMAIYIRTYLKVNYSAAVLGPCIATKTDQGDSALIDYNITFKSISDYLSRKRVTFPKNPGEEAAYQYDNDMGLLGSTIISPEGLAKNVWKRSEDTDISSDHGPNGLRKGISEFSDVPNHVRPMLLDILACKGGCVYGPAMDLDASTFEVSRQMHALEQEANSRRHSGISGIIGKNDKLYKHFDETFNPKSFMRSYKPDKTVRERIPDEKIEKAFADMGKLTDEAKCVNCGACGFETCREMAEAIALGCNIPENCMDLSKSVLSENHREVTMRFDEISEVAEKVSGFSTKLLADIENIYASLYNIDEANKRSQSKAGVVCDILSKIVGFCDGCESIGSDELPILVSTLEKLQMALNSLDQNIDESAANSTTIREAMHEVADATTQLNVMIGEMIDTADSKY